MDVGRHHPDLEDVSAFLARDGAQIARQESCETGIDQRFALPRRPYDVAIEPVIHRLQSSEGASSMRYQFHATRSALAAGGGPRGPPPFFLAGLWAWGRPPPGAPPGGCLSPARGGPGARGGWAGGV